MTRTLEARPALPGEQDDHRPRALALVDAARTATRERVRDLTAGLGLGHDEGARGRAVAGPAQDPLITSDHGLAGWLVSIPVVIVLGTALLAPWP